MPSGTKEPGKNYEVCGKSRSPRASPHRSRKHRLDLATNEIAGLFFIYCAHPLAIKKYGGLTHDEYAQHTPVNFFYP